MNSTEHTWLLLNGIYHVRWWRHALYTKVVHDDALTMWLTSNLLLWIPHGSNYCLEAAALDFAVECNRPSSWKEKLMQNKSWCKTKVDAKQKLMQNKVDAKQSWCKAKLMRSKGVGRSYAKDVQITRSSNDKCSSEGCPKERSKRRIPKWWKLKKRISTSNGQHIDKGVFDLFDDNILL